jgi:hypothetical protein
LTAAVFMQPGMGGGQRPLSYVAIGLYREKRESLHPPMMHEPSSTTAKGR